MKKCARALLETVAAETSDYCATGGFVARHDEICLTLSFELETKSVLI